MYHGQGDLWRDLLQSGLKEDGWPWDWTTLGTQQGHSQELKAQVIGKSEGVWAAETLVNVIQQCLPSLRAKSQLTDGHKYSPGTCLVQLTGKAADLLAIERPFLNLAAYVSGIATMTARFVEKIQIACPQRTPRLTLTRKTLPGYRDIAIHGVRMGGGHPHRVSLSGGVLIKENHIAAAGSIRNAIEGVKKTAPHGLKVEIEVRSEEELQEAVQAGAEGILLDNFSPEQVKSALKMMKSLSHRPFVEVSGGLTEDTIASYSLEGVDVLSVGALTHSVQVVDLSLLVDGI
jgi:nicotinate-nucleotide pyrophosphorylase (carboxylating)